RPRQRLRPRFGLSRSPVPDRHGPSCLGIDVGSTNTKVVLVDVLPHAPADACVVEVAVAGAPTPAGAVDLITAVITLVQRVLGGSGRTPHAIGVSSMAETGVPLDADGAPLTDLLRWDGHRAGAEADALARSHGRAALFAAT